MIEYGVTSPNTAFVALQRAKKPGESSLHATPDIMFSSNEISTLRKRETLGNAMKAVEGVPPGHNDAAQCEVQCMASSNNRADVISFCATRCHRKEQSRLAGLSHKS